MGQAMRRTLPGSKFAAVLAAIGGLLEAGCSQSVPSPSLQATAASSPADVGLYCKEHGVPEKFCTLCHEELKGKLVACAEHGGLPEDICTLCHPEAEQKYKLEMCPNGHKLPKHFCSECSKRPAA